MEPGHLRLHFSIQADRPLSRLVINRPLRDARFAGNGIDEIRIQHGTDRDDEINEISVFFSKIVV